MPQSSSRRAVVDGVDRRVVPADADFRGDGKRRDGADHGARHFFQKRTIAQQRRAAVFRDHLVDRAAEIQVDEIGPLPIHDHARGLAEMRRVCAEKLHAERALAFVEFKVADGSSVPAEDALGADEFRDDDIGALLLAKLPEDGVRHPGHRREVEREVVFEPREHCFQGYTKWGACHFAQCEAVAGSLTPAITTTVPRGIPRCATKEPAHWGCLFGWGAHASRRIHQADLRTPLCRRACRTLQPFVAYATKRLQ